MEFGYENASLGEIAKRAGASKETSTLITPTPAAGIESWHRTTFSARALGSVMSPVGNSNTLQFLLGHVSIQTTERYLGANRSFDSR